MYIKFFSRYLREVYKVANLKNLTTIELDLMMLPQGFKILYIALTELFGCSKNRPQITFAA